ncbi:hypothetical protein [Acinetobacter phage Ab105-2phideltaCI404ad]|nr:hypothetical protein [Acinetobacter phage Ab105-2phideltaCI404ad]
MFDVLIKLGFSAPGNTQFGHLPLLLVDIFLWHSSKNKLSNAKIQSLKI